MARWDNLVAGYKMEQSAGASAPDVLGTYDLTDHLTVGSGSGKIANAAVYAIGTQNYFDRADGPALSTFTVCGWIKVVSSQALFVIHRSGAAFSFFIGECNYTVWYNAGGWLNFGVGDGSTLVYAQWVSSIVGAWHWFCATYDGTTLSLDVDNSGSPVTSALTGPCWTGTTGYYESGKHTPIGAYSDGAIDELYAFSDVKDASWQTDMYNSGAGRTYDVAAAVAYNGAQPWSSVNRPGRV